MLKPIDDFLSKLLRGGIGKRIVKNSLRSILNDGLDYIYCIANGDTRKQTRSIMYGANPYRSNKPFVAVGGLGSGVPENK